MNLILTRSKQEGLRFRWEPCATSTPVKVVPNNENIHYDLKFYPESLQHVNKLQEKCNAGNVFSKKPTKSKLAPLKNAKKLKSSAFIEISSSSDEDSENNVRPIIKLSSTKRTHSLFLTNNLQNDRAKKICENRKVSNSNKTEKINLNIISRNLCSKGEKKNVTEVIKNNSAAENISALGEKSNIFVKTKPAISLISYSENINIQLSDITKNKSVNQSDKAKKDQHRNVPKIKETKLKSSLRIANCVSKDSKKSQKAVLKNGKLSKNLKRKNENSVNKIGVVKMRKSKNIIDKFIMPEEKPVTPVLKFKNKINQSHQLFSDSREQECINSLDLTSTSTEDNDTAKIKCSLLKDEKRLPFASYISSHPSIQDLFSNNKADQKKSKKLKQNFSKACPTKLSERALLNFDAKEIEHDEKKQTKPVKNSSENDSLIKEQSPQEEPKDMDVCLKKSYKACKQKSNDMNQKTVIKALRKIVDLSGTENKSPIATKHVVSISSNVENSNTGKINHAFSNLGSNADNQNLGLHKFSTVAGNEQKPSTAKPEFKLLKELSNKEKEVECSVFECWGVKTFKCGVFILKVKSQTSCKTLHHNSYLGGVLVKGNLKMKIGEKEEKLTEGDMAFVPPLTEWQATNTGECESVFYYWCGRFNG